jgi:carbamoyl-phosphate synthase small subunit
MSLDRRIGYLVLEDGSTFKGRFFGAVQEAAGEVVFNTSMSGYQEILTDPSYYGQLVTMTYPEIGNYGIMADENESKRVQVAGLLVRHYVQNYSNPAARYSLDAFLKEYQVPGLTGLDTRKLTLKIRNQGAMRAGIFFDKDQALEYIESKVPPMAGQNLVAHVTTDRPWNFGEAGDDKIRLAVIDFGIKMSMVNLLAQAGFYGTVFPADTPYEQLHKEKYQAIFFSNGPGDPEPVQSGRELAVKALENKVPSFGICLGHQILGLAMGGKSFKLKFGHRGGNQPVMNTHTQKVEITAQNHGFALDLDSFTDLAEVDITHLNLNDRTVEGLVHKSLPVMSVQYHPESAPGPHDARYMFQEFKKLVQKAP